MRIFLFLLLVVQTVQVFSSNAASSSIVKPASRKIPFLHAAKKPTTATTDSSMMIPSSPLLMLRGGGGDGTELVDAAYGWCCNLGAPAALVAGAVVATMYENIRGGVMEIQKDDSVYARRAKKLTSALLMSAFALQIVSIFVTTVTGTMLLSKDMSNVEVTATTALGFLREHFEFEYLTSRLSFLQGILNWLAGVALEHTIPRKGEGKAAINMNRFVAISLSTLIVLLISFYNNHMTFYRNYLHMISTWSQVAANRMFGHWRPMMLLYVPGLIGSVYTGMKAVTNCEYSEER